MLLTQTIQCYRIPKENSIYYINLLIISKFRKLRLDNENYVKTSVQYFYEVTNTDNEVDVMPCGAISIF